MVEIREHPEFHDLVDLDKSSWPRCLLWHGWADRRVAAEPDVWTDGSLVEDKVSGASSAGAGCFTFRCSRLWANWMWGHLDEDVVDDAVVSACRGFCSVPGPLQSVQRAELWGVVLALQANDGVHLGVVAVTCITCHDVELWPYSVSMLVKWVAFLCTIHWPQGVVDLGVGGVSFVELIILYELWAGERLSLEKAHPRYLRPGRPISVSAVPFGPGIDIWRSCRFIGALMRSLCLLPGGLGRFLPCSVGANHCRLRHIGEKCGHGLTSRPRESASEGFLNELLILFGYLSGSAAALLSGELPHRYCSGKFACRLPTWGLPSA